ncbi:MAG: DUF971 domain-containing protein [Pirellulales bacterium]
MNQTAIDAVPTTLAMTPEKVLRIVWSDGTTRLYTPRVLRDACPCAHCNEARLHPKPASPFAIVTDAETRPLTLAAMHPMGNYAYGVAFSDGHDSGIFTLDLLRTIGTVR